MPEKTPTQKLRENLAALREQGASREEIQDEISYWKSKIDAQSSAELKDASEMPLVAKALTGIENAWDAATLGAPSLVSDAILAGGRAIASPRSLGETFRDTRQERKERKASLAESNPLTSFVSNAVGAVVPAFIPGVGQANLARTMIGKAAAAAPKGMARKTLTALTGRVSDAAAQGAIAGGIGEFGDASGDSAVGGAIKGALGGLVGGGIGNVAGVVARGAPRVASALGKKLDEEALAAVKRMNAEDAVNYGKAAREATTTPPITDALDNDVVLRSIADELRKEAAQKGATVTDAQLAMDVYKRLSRRQRAAQTAMSRADDYRPELESQVEMMAVAKDKLLGAVESRSEVVIPGRAVAPASGRVVTRPSQTIEVEAGIPSLRAAIAGHRKNAAQIDALIEGADVGERVGKAASLPGKHLVKKGQASYLERIEEMTPEEANMAYTGLLGRGREAIRASANPLGAFGVLPSTARSVIYPFLNRRILAALERKSGRKDYGTPWRKGVGGTLARLFGYEAGS